jgi:hypothetical protein
MPELPRHPEGTPPDHASRATKGPPHARDGSDVDANRESSREPPRSDAVLAGETAIDEAIEMTFPASDPPAWTSSRTDRSTEITPDATDQP